MIKFGKRRIVQRAFIFCSIYILKSERKQTLSRINSWIEFYQNKKDLLGFENIFLIDDGSSLEDLKDAGFKANIIDADTALPENLPEGLTIFHFKNHLGRKEMCIFPGWWRSFTFSSKIAKKYNFEKVILCESDAYIIRRRLLSYVKSLASGWTALWCSKHKFPESSFQVICSDSLSKLENLYESGEELWTSDMMAERFLPFTKVEKRFIGDRYGEFLEKYPFDADYVCQAWLGMSVMEKGSFPAISITLSRKWKKIKRGFRWLRFDKRKD